MPPEVTNRGPSPIGPFSELWNSSRLFVEEVDEDNWNAARAN
jgi:hypothetical protein